jgi:hypothetical protein
MASKGGVYVLDEPTSGLHLADVEQLLGLLDRLVDAGKSVIVIEHHQAVMAHADWIIDLGPGAGHDGGRVVFEGTPADLVAARSTLTGEHLADYVGVAVAEDRGDGRVPYPPEVAPPEGLIPEAVRAAYVERTRPQPLATLTEPVRLAGRVSKLPRAYVRCTGDPAAEAGPMETFAERARAEGWLYRESATPHDLHLFDPRGTAAIIDELAGSLG